MTVQEYLDKHMVSRKIEDAVNATVSPAMAQAGGILLQKEIRRCNIFLFGGVDIVRFRKPIVVSDTLVMRMNLIKLQKRFGIAKMEGKTYVGGNVVCEGEFMLAFGSE